MMLRPGDRRRWSRDFRSPVNYHLPQFTGNVPRTADAAWLFACRSFQTRTFEDANSFAPDLNDARLFQITQSGRG